VFIDILLFEIVFLYENTIEFSSLCKKFKHHLRNGLRIEVILPNKRGVKNKYNILRSVCSGKSIFNFFELKQYVQK